MKKLITMCSFGKRDITLATILLFALSTYTVVEADMITTSGVFSPWVIPESFEGLSAVPPNITSAGNGYLQPGVVGPFTFGTGVILTGPIPNPGLGNRGVIIGDWSIGYAAHGFGTNGCIVSVANVPFGSAYLALDDSTSASSIEFTFMSDMLRVGAYVTGAPGTVTLSAFDASNSLLESWSTPSVNVDDWGSNFLGIQNPNGIRKIEVSGNFVALDELTFEVVPVPGAILLGSIGMTFSGWLLHKRRML